MIMCKWKGFEGTDEQLKEINSSKKFKLLRNDGEESYILEPPLEMNKFDIETTKCYTILDR